MSTMEVPRSSINLGQAEEDDWETDPDFLNDVGEKESRWGAKTVAGSGHQESIRLDKLREDVLKSGQMEQERKLAQMPKPSEGYGGKFGVQSDRVDNCAVGFDYKGKVEAHASQRDYSHGFGGTFGVQKDRVDKSAVGWDSHEAVEKHESQKDYKIGFGGQFGVQSDRQDKSAAGWDEREQAAKHESQTDYKKGFGGQFGVQSDRKDKSALGWTEIEKVKPHESQTDYKKGFGGLFGVQSDRQDKSALGWGEHEKTEQHESQTDYKKGFGGKFGVQSDRQDKSALGWEEREKLQAHESQTDYKKGFGGQFGVQSDRQDKSALGWEEREKVEQHESQTDYKKGFGGKFGVQSDRQDKSALGWEEKQKGDGVGENKADIQSHKNSNSDGPTRGAAKSLRSKFEQLAMQGDQQNLDRVREERERRKREDEQLRERQAQEERQRQQRLEEQWAKQSEEADEGGEKDEEQQRVQQPRQRPTIGVRLPYAIAPLPEHHSHQAVGENETVNGPTSVAGTEVDEPQPSAPVKVLPTAAEISQHKMAMVGVVTHEGNTSHNLNTKVDEENGGKLRDSGEWADEESNPTNQQVGQVHVEQQQQQHHQYELPPIVDDEVPSITTYTASVGNELSGHKSSENDQNVPPPADPTPTVSKPSADGCIASKTAVALFEYERQDDDEIGFEVNDIITDIEQIDVGWWRGTCKGRFGLFPANYVQLIERN